MGKVIVEQSISLDGFSTGPDVTNAEPMGVGGEALHEWMYRDVGPSGRNEEAEALLRTSGAVIVGRRMFDLGVDPWGDPPPFHIRSSSSRTGPEIRFRGPAGLPTTS